MTDRATEILLSGPAGTGKTRAVLEKLHLIAEKYAGMRGLIVRKTRASLTESALVTWEDHVVPAGHPILEGAKRPSRKGYSYANGSEVVVGGLDRPTRIMSTEYDFVFVQEAIELQEGEWETLTTRLRHGKMPYQQLVGDTNPDSPRHWLKQRCNAGKCKLLESRHEDNPTVTAEYLAKLDALTGPRLLRLRHGRWVQAEGVVYEGWDPAIHLIQRFEIPPDWPRFLSVDFGFTNPFVAQFWAVDHDGRLYRYREIYHTRRLVEDHAKRVRAILDADRTIPVAIVCDHDAEDRATLERHLGLPTMGAIKERRPGFQAVANRLRVAKDGKPRVLFLRDSLDERDPELAGAKKPCCTEEEFDGYCWNQRLLPKTKEEPVKQDDHGMDALRYAAWTFDSGDGGQETGGVTVLQEG